MLAEEKVTEALAERPVRGLLVPCRRAGRQPTAPTRTSCPDLDPLLPPGPGAAVLHSTALPLRRHAPPHHASEPRPRPATP